MWLHRMAGRYSWQTGKGPREVGSGGWGPPQPESKTYQRHKGRPPAPFRYSKHPPPRQSALCQQGGAKMCAKLHSALPPKAPAVTATTACCSQIADRARVLRHPPLVSVAPFSAAAGVRKRLTTTGSGETHTTPAPSRPSMSPPRSPSFPSIRFPKTPPITGSMPASVTRSAPPGARSPSRAARPT
jgi:hypothetical protein